MSEPTPKTESLSQATDAKQTKLTNDLRAIADAKSIGMPHAQLDDLPGKPMPESKMYHQTLQKDGKILGVTSPDGEYYEFASGESLTHIKNQTGGRDTLVQRKDGTQIEFEKWGPVNVRKNVETFEHQGELGKLVSQVYLLAIEQYPFLSDVDIEILGAAKNEYLAKTGGSAKHQTETGTGRPRITFNLTDGAEHYQKLLTTRKQSAQISGEKMGVEYQDLSGEQLAMFIFLHELGHAYDFLANIPGKDQYKQKRKAEMATLPIPNYNPVGVMRGLEPGGKLDSWWNKNEAAIKKSGFQTRQDLIEAQERAYHSIETEDIPDRFAAQIMLKYFANKAQKAA